MSQQVHAPSHPEPLVEAGEVELPVAVPPFVSCATTVLTPKNSSTWAVAMTDALKLKVTLVTGVASTAHLM